MRTRLSPRESEILELVAAGLTSKAIAARLGIGESTVNWHLSNALRKLGASSRAEAVAIVTRERSGASPVPPAVWRAAFARERRRWQLLLATAAAAVLATPLLMTAAVVAPPRPPAHPATAAPAGFTAASTIAPGAPVPQPGASTSPTPAASTSASPAGALTATARPASAPTHGDRGPGLPQTTAPASPPAGIPALATPALASPSIGIPALATPALASPSAGVPSPTPALATPAPVLATPVIAPAGVLPRLP